MSLRDDLPDYVFGPEIGSGGMGCVFEATHRSSGRKVALKVTHAGLPGHLLAQHRREAMLLVDATAPRVPKVHASGHFRDQVWIAMDYVEGVTLEHALSQGQLTTQGRLQILRDVAETVDHLRMDGIVHGDIKPANIVLDRAGRPWLLDFGIAMREGAKPTCVLGTPHIMAPEQLEQAAVTHRADVFQLGVLAYELFASRRPWEASMLGAVALAVAQRPPVDFLSVLSDSAAAHRSELARLAPLVQKSLNAEPDRRPFGARAWIGPVERILDACQPADERGPWVSESLYDPDEALTEVVAA